MRSYKVEFNISTSLEINHQKLEEILILPVLKMGGLIDFGLHECMSLCARNYTVGQGVLVFHMCILCWKSFTKSK